MYCVCVFVVGLFVKVGANAATEMAKRAIGSSECEFQLYPCRIDQYPGLLDLSRLDWLPCLVG